ncbi:hypothetical protein PACTADRAFT_48947 [Pachysolen tannophilus NRRL Y-2460]|uniref:pyridoxal kinase n=1 Tax=Pachysolen tannophilus NRRL Y-2460 TaxID=669874 RepID=A0A1E4TZN4_PACTA|nr:hypothetical protein PACTADRAFT_48947 [Pachysolen tannophilus NRRL Y-2460]
MSSQLSYIDTTGKNVLSIQSHVTHGYVGNRAATFPLQVKGWNLDALNTVNFSNHPGYGSFTGFKTSSEQIRDIYKGLIANEYEYNVLLTGYIADFKSLETVNDICIDYIKYHHDKFKNGDCLWVLDPVLGDNGKLYVSKEIIPKYIEMLNQGYINLITPNQFEMEVLTNTKINTLQDLYQSLIKFHKLYKVPNVIVTSVYLLNDEKIYSAGSSIFNEKPFYYKLPIIDAKFSGSGDLFSALLMDNFYTSGDLVISLGKTLTTVEAVLINSFKIEKLLQQKNEKIIKENSNDMLYIKDLKLIESKNIFLKNEIKYQVCFNW